MACFLFCGFFLGCLFFFSFFWGWFFLLGSFDGWCLGCRFFGFFCFFVGGLLFLCVRGGLGVFLSCRFFYLREDLVAGFSGGFFFSVWLLVS